MSAAVLVHSLLELSSSSNAPFFLGVQQSRTRPIQRGTLDFFSLLIRINSRSFLLPLLPTTSVFPPQVHRLVAFTIPDLLRAMSPS